LIAIGPTNYSAKMNYLPHSERDLKEEKEDTTALKTTKKL
jgi:hypothetical protein